MAEILSDAAPAHWLRDALDPAGRTVTGFVPAGYDGYLRVLNPLTVNDQHGIVGRIPWSAAARELGVPVGPWIQWDHVRTGAQAPIPERWAEPECGTVDADLATRLAAVLRQHTTTPSTCCFASWEGYADGVPGRGQVSFPPDRRMHVRTGPVEDGARPVRSDPELLGRRPLYWWPADRAWVVGADIYARSVLIAATTACLRALHTDPGLDTWPVRPDDEVDAEDW